MNTITENIIDNGIYKSTEKHACIDHVRMQEKNPVKLKYFTTQQNTSSINQFLEDKIFVSIISIPDKKILITYRERSEVSEA